MVAIDAVRFRVNFEDRIGRIWWWIGCGCMALPVLDMGKMRRNSLRMGKIEISVLDIPYLKCLLG